MGHHLIINGNAVYEIDLDYRRKKLQNISNYEKKEKMVKVSKEKEKSE